MEQQPNYYGILPAHVRYDTDLPANARLLYAEITALSNKEGYCWATNSYFSKLYKVDVCTVSRWIKKLVEKGYLISHIIRDKNTKEILERRLYIADPSTLNINRGIDKKIKRGIDKKVKDNTTSVNTTSNNIYIASEKKLNTNDGTNAPTKTKKDTKKSRTNFVSDERVDDTKNPPTLEEIESVITENKLQITAKEIFDHYVITDWIDSLGKKVTKLNYRNKVSMWAKNNFGGGKKVENIKPPALKPFVAEEKKTFKIDSKEALNEFRNAMA